MVINWIDLIIAASFVLAVIDGIKRGFVAQVLEIIVLAAALIISLKFYGSLADILIGRYGVPILVSKPVAFLGLWILIQIIGSALIFVLEHTLLSIFKKSPPDRLLGIVPAIIRNIVVIGLILSLLVALPIPDFAKRAINSSSGATKLISMTNGVTRWLASHLGGNWQSTYNFLTTNGKTAIDDATTIAKIVDENRLRTEPTLEDQMLSLINQERIKAGLQPLAMDEKLRTVAREHSKDMWLRGYFAHNTPTGQTPFDRMKIAGISYSAAGENLALAPTLSIAHDGLMHSQEHKDNILSKDFGKVGIGIISAGSNGIMVTQDFTN